MDETYTTKAIVLSRQPYRENDSKVLVYSREYGKQYLVARGTGSIKSKMAGHIEPFCLSDFMIVRGRGHDYIGGVSCQNCFANLKADLLKLEIAGRVCDIFLKLIKTSEADNDLFFLLYDFLEFLNSGLVKDNFKDLLVNIFILKMLVILGYNPELYTCVVCNKNIKPEGNRFNYSRGGLVCSECKSIDGQKISDDSIKLLRYIIKNSFPDILKIKIDNKIFGEAIINIHEFYGYNCK